MKTITQSLFIFVAAILPASAAQDPAASIFAQIFHESVRPPAQKESSSLVPHEIAGFGQCGFFAERGVRWSRSFRDGSKLELKCLPDAGSLLPGYRLWYSDGKGTAMEIARCVFNDGLNHGWYYTKADSGLLARVEWVTMDGGKNDGGSRKIDSGHTTGPEEPYLDVARWSFDAPSMRLEWFGDKYDYANTADRLPVHSRDFDPFMGPLVPQFSRYFVLSAGVSHAGD